MAKYLDQNGLTYFWGKIKAKINDLTADKIGYTNELIEAEGNVKAALDVLAQVASEYANHEHDTQYVPLSRTIAGLSLNNNIAAEDLTSKLTNASGSANGLMSKDDYSKLNALPTKAALEETYAKKTDISSVYKPAGSITPTSGKISNPHTYLTAANLGKVYHVTAEFTSDEYFMSPEAGKKYPAGTNIVIADTDPWQASNGTTYTYKFDILAGFVDLSNYATKDDLDSIEVDAITNAEIDTIVAS